MNKLLLCLCMLPLLLTSCGSNDLKSCAYSYEVDDGTVIILGIKSNIINSDNITLTDCCCQYPSDMATTVCYCPYRSTD